MELPTEDVWVAKGRDVFAGKTLIARCWGRVGDRRLAAIANAKLIAAAPTMLDYIHMSAAMGDSDAQAILDEVIR